MKKFFVVDSHCDTLGRIHKADWDSFNFDRFRGPINLETMEAGSVKLQFFAAYVDESFQQVGSLRYTLQLIDTFHRLMKRYHSRLTHIKDQEDIEQLQSQPNRIGALLAIEGGEALEGSLEMLSIFYRLGVRSIGLTWNHRNLIADGCGESRTRGGLSRFGHKVITVMEEKNMIIDLAHISEAGFWDVLASTSKPLLVSHSNCRHLCDHPRNLQDRQIKALQQRSSMLGINFYPPFLSTNRENVDINKVVDHIEHACQVAGSYKHVGVGSDFDGINQFVPYLESAAHYPRLWDALLHRGFSEEQVKAIAGENYTAFLKKVLPSRKVTEH
ncbi:dipeptidase [Heliorestis convoluta]|uniref:Membrane dipeptidase n=1 Tax=Heliorestis convoluta TaxID=356322 RepID=A0A5Q2MWR3_9FIRM|nr:dipeptidase [Heliorestis convoluta]QGG46908.1 membrane dipeptidase [Heliorestis convoluta]